MAQRARSVAKRDSQAGLRKHVLEVLRGGHAHAAFEDATANVPPELRGVAPAGAPYTLWQLVEHIRIAQRDILDFSRNADGRYQSLEWPAGYWPPTPTPPSDAAWTKSLRAIKSDRRVFEDIVADPATDLLTPFSWGDGQTLLREALLAADHSSYHTGQIVLLRRMLGIWRG